MRVFVCPGPWWYGSFRAIFCERPRCAYAVLSRSIPSTSLASSVEISWKQLASSRRRSSYVARRDALKKKSKTKSANCAIDSVRSTQGKFLKPA